MKQFGRDLIVFLAFIVGVLVGNGFVAQIWNKLVTPFFMV